jgi:MYXO-CTERM domain-containing protein
MNRLALLVLVSLPAFAAPKVLSREAGLLKIHSADFHPNPGFVHARNYMAGDPKPGNVEQMGEIVILEGDDQLVSTSKDGFGIVVDARAQNPVNITNRFYTKYGDDFDEIIIFTTFDDVGAQGAAAYEISTQQDVKGLGQDIFDDSVSWGSQGGKLHAFVNMMKWDQFDGAIPMTDPRSDLYSVLGQEFAHRWLAFLRYTDSTGAISTAMLGRDGAHWASTLSANGSFMDGNVLTLTSDGYYQTSALMSTYWALDLYAMGLAPATEVPPWFLIKNAVTSTGRMVNPAVYLRNGAKIQGTREDIEINQVLAAEGPRTPAWDQSPHAFRVAFVVVTKPGEHASQVMNVAKVLDEARVVWEKQFAQYTGGRASMCTQVSAPCGALAAAHILGGEVVEHGGNMNGVVEPGEPVLVTFHVVNDSEIPAHDIEVHTEGNFLSNASSTVIDQLQPAEKRDVVFAGTLPADAVCGEALTIDVASTVDGHTFRGFAEVTPGLQQAKAVDFNKSRQGWIANPDGKDTTTVNGWEFGTPQRYGGFNGWSFQPGACYSSSKCWFTGLQTGHRGMMDSSLGVGESHLYSTPIDLHKTYLPILNFAAWFQALDFSNAQNPQDASGVQLIVEGSTDGGATWTNLDTVSSTQPAWQPRSVALDGLIDTSGKLMLRFTIANPAMTDAVEAGVDGINITTQTAACNPDQPAPLPMKSSGCSIADAPTSSMLVLLLFLGAALLRRRLFV